MKITFSIEYVTRWGEQLFLLRDEVEPHEVAMNYGPGHVWSTTIEVDPAVEPVVQYAFAVWCDGQWTRREAAPGHHLFVNELAGDCRVRDCWRDDAFDPSTLGVSELSEGYMTDRSALAPTSTSGSLMLLVNAPAVGRGQALAVLGEAPELGCWQPSRAVVMRRTALNRWCATLSLPPERWGTQYKFVMLDLSDHTVVEWEDGVNRWLPTRDQQSDDTTLIVRGLHYRGRAYGWRACGTVITVPQLRSERDMGIGDLGDLLKVVQWAGTTRQQAVVLAQALTDATDLTPWAPVEIAMAVRNYALNPLLLSMRMVGELSDRRKAAELMRRAYALNSLAVCDVAAVATLKADQLAALMEEPAVMAVTRQRDFKRFVSDNAFWLKPYAAYRILTHVNGTSETSRWGVYAQWKPTAGDRLLRGRRHEYQCECLVQYHLFTQLQTVIETANTHGVKLLQRIAATPTTDNLDDLTARLQGPEALVTLTIDQWVALCGASAQPVVRATLPGDTQHGTHRLPVSVEALVADSVMNRHIASLLLESRR